MDRTPGASSGSHQGQTIRKSAPPVRGGGWQSAVVSSGFVSNSRVIRAIRFVARAVGLHVHLVGDVEIRLAKLDGARFLVVAIPLTQLRKRFHRRRGSKGREPMIEIALHTVLEDDGTIGVVFLRIS